MKSIRILLLAFAIFGLSGCCIKSVEVKPKMNAFDLIAAKAGSIDGNIKIDFKECCPSKEQEKLVFSVQSKIADLYTKLLNDKISIEKYNEKITLGTNALQAISYGCNSKKKLKKLNIAQITYIKSKKSEIKHFRTMSLDKAWEELRKVNQKL